jgi:glutathione S-transferase
MSAPGTLTLYELVLASGRSASPYVWRVRYALAHKGLAAASVPLGFTEIPKTFDGRFKTVPVLAHGATLLAESWDIVQYLDRTFPQQPLFGSPGEIAASRLIDAWLATEVVRRAVPIYVLDVHDAARPEDQGYFRQSRQARFNGTSLEAVTAGREARLPALREALAPLRARLAQSPFLGGATPTYADYMCLGFFQWLASIATLPPLAGDDTVLLDWLERGFDLYGGIGRDLRLRPLCA